jgi:hypothetical protein
MVRDKMAGNYRSGRTGWREKVENLLALDVMELKRDEIFASDSQHMQISPFFPDGLLQYAQGYLHIFYELRDDESDSRRKVKQTVVIDHSPCAFGGTRPWFRCPLCQRRIAKLYGGDSRHYLCRACHGLAYQSQSETWSGRRYLKANRLRAQLGGKPGAQSVLKRPRGTHWKTFAQLYWKIKTLEAEAIVRVAEDSYPTLFPPGWYQSWPPLW